MTAKDGLQLSRQETDFKVDKFDVETLLWDPFGVYKVRKIIINTFLFVIWQLKTWRPDIETLLFSRKVFFCSNTF